jgi:hypothetical protein
MKKFRLKKDAVPFFKEGLANSIYDFDTWKGLSVDINALEEVEEGFIKYGHAKGDTTSLSEFGNDGSEFHFTIHFPSMKYMEYNEFSQGRTIRQLIESLQYAANRYFERFNNED